MVKWLFFAAVLLPACSGTADQTPQRVYLDANTYILSTARTAPSEKVVERGPYTLEYVGAHTYSTETSVTDIVDEETGDTGEEPYTEDEAGIDDAVYDAILTDSDGTTGR